MIENENNGNFNNEKKKKKKRILIVLFCLIFLVPIGFGIYNLIPDRPIPPAPAYEVQLVDNYGNGLSLSSNTAYPDSNFRANITINRSILADKILPNFLNSDDVKCNDQPISFTYAPNVDHFTGKIIIPSENIKGKITINIPLVTPTDTFTVTLKGNGGKFNNGQVALTLEAAAGAKLIDLEGYNRPSEFREGYHFTHWELESDRTIKLHDEDLIPYSPGGVTYLANCELNEIAVTINPNGGKFPDGVTAPIHLNTLYDTVINEITGYPGEPSKDNSEFLYYRDVNNKIYSPDDTVTIPGLVFGLEAVYQENLTITLDANGGTFPDGSPTKTFETHRGITLSELEDYVEPTSSTPGEEFTYWSINGSGEYYKNTPLDYSNTVTLTANYYSCTHDYTFEKFTVIDNRLYGICPNCKAQVLIPDTDLSEYNNKFLMIENTEDSPTDKYVMHEISEMAGIVNTAKNRSVLDMYFINGTYELGGSRGAGQEVITVNVHGLLNSENKPTASIDCTRATEWPEPRHHHLINFVFENLRMVGEDTYSAGYYFGLFSDTITYNHCYFKGKQSFYSDQVICNDCEFDSTGMLDKPDYAIYGYSSHKVDFNHCDFLSDGKAIKIYSEGSLVPDAKYTYKFTDCNFKINELISDKAAIQVDSIAHATTPYNVYITRCHQTGYIGGLYNDSSTHTNFIVTEI